MAESQFLSRTRITTKKPGLQVLKNKTRVFGMKAIDRRSTGFRAALRWRNQLAVDLGGESALSAQKKTLLEICLHSKIFLDHIDCWLFCQKRLVHNRALLPALQQRFQIAAALERTLVLLGLDRIPKGATLSLEEFAARRWKALEENNPEPAGSREQDSEPSEAAEQDSEPGENE